MAATVCGALAVLLALPLLALPLLARAQTTSDIRLPCPKRWSCTPRLPSGQRDPHFAYNGKFLHRGNYYDEAENADDGILKMYYFQADDFPAAFSDITGGVLRDAQEACFEVCAKRYNKEASHASPKLPEASYWMFEQTCEDGPGGQCLCMRRDVCEPAPATRLWSDQWQETWEYGQFFAIPANYTTGKLCSGKIKGDPHFTGGDESHFEFSGLPNKTFAIISDAHVQVNAYLGGRFGPWEGRIKAMTWIRTVSIMWGHHVAVIAARQSSDARYLEGYLDSVLVDNEPLEVQPHGSASGADGQFTIAWTGVKIRSGSDWVDEFQITVGGILTLRLVARPEVPNLRTRDDAVIHFTLNVDTAHLSSNAHGVLGQTFRPDFSGRLARQRLVYSPLLGTKVVPGDNAEGFIDGRVEDYVVRDLLKADCALCRFAREREVDEETARAMALSAMVSTQSLAARRLLTVPARARRS